MVHVDSITSKCLLQIYNTIHILLCTIFHILKQEGKKKNNKRKKLINQPTRIGDPYNLGKLRAT